MEFYLGQRKINPRTEGTAIVTQRSGSILSFSAVTKCRRTGTASCSSRENDCGLSSKASSGLSRAPGEPSREFPIVAPGGGSVTLPGVIVRRTLMAVLTPAGCSVTRALGAACATAGRAWPPPSPLWKCCCRGAAFP